MSVANNGKKPLPAYMEEEMTEEFFDEQDIVNEFRSEDMFGDDQ